MNATVKQLKDFFVGRTDVYGNYPKRIYRDNKPYEKEESLTNDILQLHLNKEITIGICYACLVDDVLLTKPILPSDLF